MNCQGKPRIAALHDLGIPSKVLSTLVANDRTAIKDFGTSKHYTALHSPSLPSAFALEPASRLPLAMSTIPVKPIDIILLKLSAILPAPRGINPYLKDSGPESAA